MKDYKITNEIDYCIKNMDEEDFNDFCKNFNEEQVKIMQGARFFNKIFNNPTLMEKLQIYMTTNNYDKMKEVIDTVIDGSFSKKEKNFVCSNSFFFFVDAKDKQYCKKLLDCCI